MNGTDLRKNRLFNQGLNAVIIAIDHGMFDGPIPGMIDLQETAEKISPVVDGILLSPGMIKHLQSSFNFKGAPMPIVRVNWSTVYCFHWNYNAARTVTAQSVYDAVASGAEMVLISLTIGTGDEDTDAKNVEVFSALKSEAEKLGIPVLGEYFPIYSDKLTPKELHEKVSARCRILSELGADMIKTFYTNNFKAVTNSCPVPIFGLGAEKTPRQIDALQLARNEIDDGARGVVFGRNAIQVPDPSAFQQALCEIVKKGVDPENAVKKFNLKD